MPFLLHIMSVWEAVFILRTGLGTSSLLCPQQAPSPPRKRISNCLNTFHTPKQESTFHTFKIGLVPTREVAGLVNSIHTSHTTHRPYTGLHRSSWYQRGSSLGILEACRAQRPGLRSMRSRVGDLAGLHFSLCRMGWALQTFIQSLPVTRRPCGEILQAGHFLGQWPWEVTIVVNKFNCTTCYSTSSG